MSAVARTIQSRFHAPDEARMTLAEHLRELRRRIVIAVLAIIAGTILAFVFHTRIQTVVTGPYCSLPASFHKLTGNSCTLIVTGILDPFTVTLRLSLYAGLLLSSPVWLWQLWRFVTPGLYARERRWAVILVGGSVALAAVAVPDPGPLRARATMGGHLRRRLVRAVRRGRRRRLLHDAQRAALPALLRQRLQPHRRAADVHELSVLLHGDDPGLRALVRVPARHHHAQRRRRAERRPAAGMDPRDPLRHLRLRRGRDPDPGPVHDAGPGRAHQPALLRRVRCRGRPRPT